MSGYGRSDPRGDTLAVLLGLIEELALEMHPDQPGSRSFSLESSLDRDVGLDSLARVELINRIERHFGVGMPEQVFAEAQNVRDLFEALAGAGSPCARPAGPHAGRRTSRASRTVPDKAQTLVDVLKWHVDTHPDQPQIRILKAEDGDEVITYQRLWQQAHAVAAGLLHRGLQHGEAVAIMLPTGADYFFSFFGVILAGGIPVPVYPPVRLAQLEDHMRRHFAILANCRAAVLVTVPEARGLAQLLKAHADSLRNIVTVTDLSRGSDAFDAPLPRAEDIAFLQYTSGSTGNPKGVILSHANLLANIRAMGAVVRADASDVFVSWLPLYHDMGLIGAWLGTMYHAASLVIMSPLTFLSRPHRWLRAIHRFRGTLAAAPNFAYELCLRRIDDQDLEGLDLSSWRAAFNGAEPVSPETVEGFCERFARYGFRREAMAPVYGLAEASVGLSLPPPGRGLLIDRIQRTPFMERGAAIPAADGEPKAVRFVACGQPLGGHEVRVVDDAGRELPERQAGRLQFRGPSATPGYYRNPEATRHLVRGEWLEPGDLAYIADGDVYITGRTKDIIIRAGRNIYPHEIEDAISNLAGIRTGRVAVFGSPDPGAGTERLIVIAETHATGAEALDRLRSEINTLAASLAGGPPDDIVLAPPGTVLKTSSGKIRRSASHDMYRRGTLGRKPLPVWWQVLRLALAGAWPLLRRLGRTTLASLYAAYAWMAAVLIAPITWVVVVLLPQLEWRWHVLRAAARCLARATFTSWSIQGFEHLPPAGRACVLVANHASYLDSYFLVAFLPRIVSFVAKAELAARFSSRVFLTRIGTEFVERFDKQQGVADARRVARSLREGRSLLFFPEGTFARGPGLLPFHMGAFVAAAEANAPCVPIAIRGTRSILRCGSWFPRRGRVSIHIGPPLEAKVRADGAEMDPWKKALGLRAAARDYLLRQCGEPDVAHGRSPP